MYVSNNRLHPFHGQKDKSISLKYANHSGELASEQWCAFFVKDKFRVDLIFITLTFLSAVSGKAPCMLTSLSRRISPMSSLHFLLGLLLLFFYFSLAYCKIRGTRDIYNHSMDIPVPPKLYVVNSNRSFSQIFLYVIPMLQKIISMKQIP